jgi:hypothetical protein
MQYPDAERVSCHRKEGHRPGTITPCSLLLMNIKTNGTQFDMLNDLGLITFAGLGDFENSISLCPNCHSEFDNTSLPGFVFFPHDLQYFIEFECSDYLRRERQAEQGTLISRVCTNAQGYKMHQMRKAVDQDAWGGLYQRYILRDYLPRLAQSRGEAWDLRLVPKCGTALPPRRSIVHFGFMATLCLWPFQQISELC